MRSFEERRRAAIEAPRQRHLLRPDSRLIERAGWLQLITPSAPPGTTYLNEIVHSDVPSEDAERVIGEAIATYHGDGRPVRWRVGPWTAPDDFGERLERRGFVGTDTRGMGIATTDVRRAASARAAEVTVESVTAASLGEYLETYLRGWQIQTDQKDAETLTHLAALHATAPSVLFFLARRSGAPVGTASVLLRDTYGYLVGGQVLESARGLGAYQALVAARLAFLAARGIDLAVTQARAATSAPILERLGFETLFRSKVYELRP